jgi:serine/threonine protein kinase
MSSSDKEPVAPFRPEDTDDRFPTHWKSGSLKYGDFTDLAKGGTAILYAAVDKNLHRTVAFKTLHKDLRDSEIETCRFVREARVTANIQHPGTVPVYELGRDRGGNLFFSMKKVNGRDLRDILADLKAEIPDVMDAFPLPRLVDILIQIGQTVAYAHSVGVIHRDLKPANIQIGSFGEVVVLDWGLAKIVGEPQVELKEGLREVETIVDDLTLTPPGRRYGTPLYMSPEIARGDPEIDGRSDVFSLGNMMFELLTRQQLLSGETVDKVIDNLLKKPLRGPTNAAPELKIPRELEAICVRALRIEPEDRYQTVQEFVEDLQRYRHGEEVSVYNYSGLERINRWNNRNALTLTALISGFTGFLLHWLFSR